MMNRIRIFTLILCAVCIASCRGLVEYIREAQQKGREQNEATYKVVFNDEDSPNKKEKETENKSKRKKEDNSSEKAEKYTVYEKKWNIPLTGEEDITLLEELDSWIGTPYKYGGASKTGTDCSGMVLSIYKKLYNIDTKRSAYDLWQQSSSVKKENLKYGDLVFFKINYKQVSHVGIYIANGYFIHASSSRGVIIDHLDTKYYAERFSNGGRVNK
jgi:murein DD-endopeptidase / murein LD-carboxypeptidase